MVLSLIVYSALEITSTAAWWVVKNTGIGVWNGVSYIIYGPPEEIIPVKSNDLKALTFEVQRLNEEVKYLRNKDKKDIEQFDIKMIEYKTPP
jgi:hypothetical protein